ncbi:hypothetical protein HOI83_00430 [Candidatus Uhrbacteria bacterium]|jgi:hypothetical protein|nr:hypothetical protein [Candidatus Uhrbacteria bacterium]
MREYLGEILIGIVLLTMLIAWYRSSDFRMNRRIKQHKLIAARHITRYGNMERWELKEAPGVDQAIMECALAMMRRDGMIKVKTAPPPSGTDAIEEFHSFTDTGETWAQELLA